MFNAVKVVALSFAFTKYVVPPTNPPTVLAGTNLSPGVMLVVESTVITFVVAVVSDNTARTETFAIFNLFAILFFS